MTKLTRQHFRSFAAEIQNELATRRRRGLDPERVAMAQAELASRVFARYNPHFDKARFYVACGLPVPPN